MTSCRMVLLVVLFACVVPRPASADQPSGPEAEITALWKEYCDLRKNRAVAETRRRKLIARELARFASERAMDRLCEIFEKDPCPPPRLAALVAICQRGDPACVKKIVSKARRSKDYVRLWLGTALTGADDPEVGRWLAGEKRLLSDRKAGVLFVEALGHLRVKEAVEPLAALHEKLRKSRTKVELHYEVIAALGRIGGERAVEVLLDAAGHEDPRRRLAVAQTALASGQSGTLLKTTCLLFGDADWRVREAAAQAAGASGNKRFVPDLIPLLENERLRTRASAQAALTRLAGIDLGTSGSAWSDWWKQHCDQAAGGSTDSPTVAVQKDKRLSSDGVLFVLDVSKSMGWQEPHTTRLEVARARLTAWIRRLKPPTVFNVIALAGRPYPWKKARGKKSGSVPATPENIKEAVAWVESRETAVHTNVYAMLEQAVQEMPEIDTIYYVGDGTVGVGGYVPNEEILPRFRQLNRFRRLVVNSVFLMWSPRKGWAVPYEDADEQAEFLRTLSEESGGSFEELRGPPSLASTKPSGK